MTTDNGHEGFISTWPLSPQRNRLKITKQSTIILIGRSSTGELLPSTFLAFHHLHAADPAFACQTEQLIKIVVIDSHHP